MNARLIEIIEQQIAQNPYTGKPVNLYEPINYIMQLGGKRIRPVLTLMAAEVFTDEIHEDRIIKVAQALEVFHNFTLVHDDIMDEAPVRRGKATVHEKWNRDIAILSGDVMFVKSYELLVASENKRLADLLKVFNQSAIEVCEGQQLDMNFESQDSVSLSDYIEMIRLKTAVLLACSLKMGAIAADSELHCADALYHFGINLGIAFQIQDDYLDAFGDPEKFGKQVGGDIIANKKTFLAITALSISDEQLKEKLQSEISENHQDKVNSIKSIYTSIGVDTIAKEAIDEYYQKAILHLSLLKEAGYSVAALKALAAQIMGRDH